MGPARTTPLERDPDRLDEALPWYLNGTLDEAELARRFTASEACVVMKVGRNLGKILRALDGAGRLDEAIYVERGTMAAMRTVRLADKPDNDAPYFSIVLVPGWAGMR